MAVNEQIADRLIKGLHTANKGYFVKTFHLSEAEAEFLLSRWKTYVKERPEVMKRSPILCLDSFIHGYLSHASFSKSKSSLSPALSDPALASPEPPRVKTLR